MKNKVVIALIGSFAIFINSAPLYASCVDDWGNEIPCEGSNGSDKSLWDHAAETVKEVYQEYNNTDGDSYEEQITDDPYWDENK